MKEQQIKFKNKKYLFIEGAITTKKNYENGLASYAHLYSDGKIKRYGKIIGDKKDITKLRKIEVHQKVSGLELLANFLEGKGGW